MARTPSRRVLAQSLIYRTVHHYSVVLRRADSKNSLHISRRLGQLLGLIDRLAYVVHGEV